MTARLQILDIIGITWYTFNAKVFKMYQLSDNELQGPVEFLVQTGSLRWYRNAPFIHFSSLEGHSRIKDKRYQNGN